MSDGQNQRGHNEPRAMAGNVTMLAGRALSVVAATANANRKHPDPDFTDQMIQIITDPSEKLRRRFLNDAIPSGLSPATLIDIYIPAVARILGDKWCSDQMS
ncbi:MAG: hypothetical protein AAF701_09190, partial [Pseudomonadota bacterium]